MNGTAACGESVVIVEVQSGRVNLKPGRISGTDSGPASGDKRATVVVWEEREIQPAIGDPQEGHEKRFQIDDVHLLTLRDVRTLWDLGAAQEWFGSIYQDQSVAKIHRALKRLKRNEPSSISPGS